MFRSFHSRERVSKTVKPSKRSFREHAKSKLQQSVNNPVGRYAESPSHTIDKTRNLLLTSFPSK